MTAHDIEARVESAGVDGPGLKAGKGNNLPDTRPEITALPDDELEALPFVVRHADIVNPSLVPTAADMSDLSERVTALGRNDLDAAVAKRAEAVILNSRDTQQRSLRGGWDHVPIRSARQDAGAHV